MNLYHISFNSKLPNTIYPRQPDAGVGSDIDDEDGMDLSETDIDRISLSDNLEGCIRGVYANVSKLFEDKNFPYLIFQVYMPVSIKRKYLITPKTLTKKRMVHDAHVTSEYIYTEPLEIVLVGTVKVYNTSSGKGLQYRPYNDKQYDFMYHSPKEIKMDIDMKTHEPSLESSATTKNPFNIELLSMSNSVFKRIRPTTSLDIFEGASKVLHSDGLYSTETYGMVGSPERFSKFSYVDIGVEVLHPKIYKDIIRIKKAYGGIINGREYAIWDKKVKEFVMADALTGETGYSFFMSHINELKLARTKSDVRNIRIDVFEKNRKANLLTSNKILIIPAGIRDVEIDDAGRTTVPEINDLYRKLIAISKTVTIVDGNANVSFNDTIRWNIQRTFNEIYDTLYEMINGKKGFIQAKFASRKIFNGTRNVLSNMDLSTNTFNKDTYVGPHVTVCGLYQGMMGQPSITKFHLKREFLDEQFGGGLDNVQLVDMKTLELKYVQLEGVVYEKWYSGEGLFKTMGAFVDPKLRHKPIIIGGSYLHLVYRDDKGFLLLKDIKDLPESFDPALVKPITYAEFFFIATYKRFKTSVGAATRYPITGMGSIYASKIQIRTTFSSFAITRYEPNGNLSEDKEDFTNFYPDTSSTFLDTMIVSTVRLAALGADFDGDKLSLNFAESKEAIDEIHTKLGLLTSYISPLGGLELSAGNSDVFEFISHNLTKGKVK